MPNPTSAFAITVLAFTACSSPPAAHPQTTSKPSSPPGATALLDDAERALEQARRLDYRAPADAVRATALETATRKFMEACMAGEPSGCWRAASLHHAGMTTAPIAHQAAVKTAQACLTGDHPSCTALGTSVGARLLEQSPSQADAVLDACTLGDRAACDRGPAALACLMAPMPEPGCDPLRDPGDPAAALALVTAFCHRGLGAACDLLADRGPGLSDAQRADLEREACQHGFAAGCELAASRAGSGSDRAYNNAQREKANRTACADGDAFACQRINSPTAERVAWRACQAGLIDDCPMAHSAQGLEQMCITGGDQCDALAKLRDGSEAERDALEQGCQFQRDKQCRQLVDGYDDRKWPQPKPGRADELRQLMCREPATDDPEWYARHCAKGTR